MDTVLFCQQQIAARDKIKIVYSYGSVFPADGIDADTIYTIFPNALDNAIEASRKTQQPCEIGISSKIAGDTVVVVITNPYVGDIKMKNKVPQTDKNDRENHGYGIRSILRAASRYGTDNVEFIAKNGIFTLRFSLCFKTTDSNKK